MSIPHLLIWIVCAMAIAGVIVRPFRWPEAIWAVAGAGLLVVCGLLSARDALFAIARGTDVYLFLLGMMLLAEVARREGLFDWVAVHAVNAAKGSQRRLFLLVFAVGTAVTVFLSNDATAVVLTPAVFAAARRARVEALPFLFICAFIANGASFVLPISNPANLVLYADKTPVLLDWLARFALPSLVAILATYVSLRVAVRRDLVASYEHGIAPTPLTPGGKTALAAIGCAALLLMTVSAFDIPLGLPTAILGVLTAAAVLIRDRASPWPVMKDVSWAVLLLVAGLFVLVEALDKTGLVELIARALRDGAAHAPGRTAASAGAILAVVCNLTNNLPAGLIASLALAKAQAGTRLADALLIGVDLGPNLSITGSLATILWLSAIRREGAHVGFWKFLKMGALVMPPALLLALAARLVAP